MSLHSPPHLLAIAIGTTLCPVALSAENHEPHDSHTEEPVIVVTGTAKRSNELSTPSDVSVIEGDAKERIASAGLGGFVKDFAGIDTIGTGDQVSNVVIRGLSGNRVSILSDEIKLDFQQYGIRHPANIDPYIADRIEVVRGAASILYGSDAIGGVVNIIPQRPPIADPGEGLIQGRGTIGYQSAFRQWTGALTLKAAHGPLGAVGTIVLRDSDGLVVPDAPTALQSGDRNDPLVTGNVPFTDYTQENWDISLGYETGIGQIIARWEAYRSDQNFVLPDPPPPDFDAPLQPGGIGQWLDNDSVQLSANLEIGDDLNVRPTLSYSRNMRLAGPGGLEPQPLNTLPDSAVIDIVRENYAARIDFAHGPKLAGLSGRIGLEAVLSKQESNGTSALTPGGEVRKLAVYALEEKELDRLILNAGARFDYIETQALPDKTAQIGFLGNVPPRLLKQDHTVISASFGAVYKIDQDLSLTANLARGFRAPSLFELFVNGVHGGVSAVQRGNPNLDAETSLSSDISVRYNGRNARFKLTGYINDIQDYIFLSDTGASNPAGLSIFQVNQQNAQLQGFDIEADYHPTDWIELSTTLEYVDGELDDGTPIPLLPPLRARFQIEFSQENLGPADDAFLNISVEYAADKDAESALEPFVQFDTPPQLFGTASTDEYTLVGIHAGAKFGAITLNAGIDNLFDVAYRDFLDTYKVITLSPGRNLSVSLSAQF